MQLPARQNFLLAVDGSADADRAALYIARRASRLGPCEVHLLHVHALGSADATTAGASGLVLQAGDATERARRLLDETGLAFRFHAEIGDPVKRILEVAARQACTEIVVGSRGLGWLAGLALGSVAYRVAHLSPVAVTVVPNPMASADLDLEDGTDVHRILLPVDGSAYSARAVDYVCALRGAALPVEVRLFNAQVPIASGNVRRFIPQETIDAWHRSEAEAAFEGARTALRGAGLRFDERFEVGQAAQAIVQEAHALGCTRIVMGTRGLGAIAGLVLGSTALQVLQRAEIPVTLAR